MSTTVAVVVDAVGSVENRRFSKRLVDERSSSKAAVSGLVVSRNAAVHRPSTAAGSRVTVHRADQPPTRSSHLSHVDLATDLAAASPPTSPSTGDATRPSTDSLVAPPPNAPLGRQRSLFPGVSEAVWRRPAQAAPGTAIPFARQVPARHGRA